MSESFPLGADAKIYYGTSGANLSALTELPNVIDANVDTETGTYDNASRENGGFDSSIPTTTKITITFGMTCKPGDANYIALRKAQINKTPLRFASLTGARTSEDVEGPIGDFFVTTLNRTESLKEGIKYDVTLELNSFSEWVGVSLT